MSKAILITDMPENCGHCMFCVYCAKGAKPLHAYGKPDWCPLISLPPQATPNNNDMSIEWNLGWNAFLDTLEGKT